MMNAYYTPGYDKLNYEEAQRRIKEAMESGKKYVYLPGKNGGSIEFTWSATEETIERLRKDGFDIDVTWNPCIWWSVEWGISKGTIMNNKKELRHRCHCPHCKKVFDNRYEGFVVEGYLICADCYQKYAEFLKQRKNKNERES